MPGFVRILLTGFLLSSLVCCREKRLANELTGLDLSLVKAFISDTNYYEYAYFKMRVLNKRSRVAHLYIEKWAIPFVTQKNPGQQKNVSIFMLDSNRNKLNELLLWPLYPNKNTVKPNKPIEFWLRAPIAALINSDGDSSGTEYQRRMTMRIRNSLYSCYSLNKFGAIDDSVAIRVDSNFLIEYRAPMVTD